MNAWDEYRVKAAELSARAACETNAKIQAELESLAQSYLRLALQAEQNSRLDLTYETPLPRTMILPPSGEICGVFYSSPSQIHARLDEMAASIFGPKCAH